MTTDKPRKGPILLIVLMLIGLTSVSAQADYIFLNDGFTLQGRLLKQYDFILDASSTQVAISKLGGYYMVDDGARRTLFPTRLVSGTDALDRRLQMEMLQFRPSNLGWHPQSPGLGPYHVQKNHPWNPDGTRSQVIHSASEKNQAILIDQKVNTLSPHFLEAKVRLYRHYVSYLTKEFEPDAILAMVRTRVKAEAKDGKLTLDDHLRIVRFAAQAGWSEKALAELKSVAQLFPTELERLAQTRLDIKKSQIKQILEELDDAVSAGQHGRAQTLLAGLDEEGADSQELTKISVLKNKYKQQNGELERIRKLLLHRRQAAPNTLLSSKGQRLFDEIDRDLNLDTAPLLGVFLQMSEQEDRFAARGLPASLSAEQQLALAVTGWLLGANGAEKHAETAVKLAQGREFLQRFLTTDESAERDRLAADYLQKHPLRVDEVTQLIEQLPPPRAEPLGKSIMDLVTRSTTLWTQGVKYRLYLPPEYHHHRAYPLLILAPNFGETYESTTKAWLEPAARKGFLIAVPEWVEAEQSKFMATDKEHEAVTEVLRDLRRRFRIDNNRVSLAGHSSAGSLVFEVALSRPHLFAGAVVICGHTPDGIEELRYNAQYLPFYIVDGTKNWYREKKGPKRKDVLELLFEYWIPKQYPSLLVEYQGRGFEQFPAEVPIIFDWLSRKKRATAMPELGKPDIFGSRTGQEFRSIRPSANRFYWITCDEMTPTVKSPVLVSGSWEKNTLRTTLSGMKKARVWLNAGMVDFELPVEIRITGGIRSTRLAEFKKKLEPNLAVMLEDYFLRGDSKNLYSQFVDFVFSR